MGSTCEGLQEEVGGWSLIQDICKPKKDNKEGVYVHPLVKRSSNTLSIKSLEMCTESLGSETGSDIGETIKEHETDNPRRQIGKKHNRITNFPPPLTSIVQVRQYRQGGRLILKATTITAPISCFKAERADGRLRLSFWNASDDGHRKGYIRPTKCKENGGRIKGIPSWEPFWVAIS